MSIDRREALKRTAIIMGGALSAPAIMGILEGCTPTPQPNWTPTFFTVEQAETIMNIVDVIIPKTDTAGAKEVGVPKFVEDMVSKIYDEKNKLKFMEGLAQFEADCNEKMGKAFSRLEENKRLSFVMQENKAMQEKAQAGDYSDGKSFFRMVKELTLLGYFTSEVGATQVLQYKQVPGVYQGCITLAEAGGKTWATG